MQHKYPSWHLKLTHIWTSKQKLPYLQHCQGNFVYSAYYSYLSGLCRCAGNQLQWQGVQHAGLGTLAHGGRVRQDARAWSGELCGRWAAGFKDRGRERDSSYFTHYTDTDETRNGGKRKMSKWHKRKDVDVVGMNMRRVESIDRSGTRHWVFKYIPFGKV